MNLKYLSSTLILVLIVNMVLFALKIIAGWMFWNIIIMIGLIAYFILPKLKR